MRSRRNLTIIPAVIVAVLLVGVFLRQPLGRFVLGKVLGSLGRTFHGRVTYGSISGDVFAHPRLTDLLIITPTDSFKVESLDLRYNLPGMLRGRFAFSDVRVVRPTAFLSSARAESAGPEVKSKPAFPTASVSRLTIVDGRLYSDTVMRLDSVDLDLRLDSRPEVLRAALDRATGRLVQERLFVRGLTTRFRMTADSLEFMGLDVATGHSRAKANMHMAFADQGVSAQIESLSVSLPEFTSLPGRVLLKGNGSMRDEKRSARVEYSASGLRWREILFPTTTGTVALKDKEVRLTASGADSSLGQFDLSASLSLADSSYSARATLAGIVLRRVDRTLPDFRVDVQADVAGRGLDSVAGTMRGAVPDLGIDSLFAAGRLVRGRAIVDQFAASGPVGTLAGSGSWTKSRLAVDCRMETLDLALLHRVSNVQASGRVSGKLIASGTVDSVDAWGVVRCRRLEMPGVTVDGGSGQFKVAFGRALHGMLSLATGPVKAGGVTTDSVRLSFADSTFVVSIGSGKTAVTMNGTTAIERAAFSLVVESLLVRTPRETVAVARPLELRLANDSVHVLGSAAGVAGGDIRCDVVSVRGKLVQAAATVQNVDMERLAELLHVRTDASGVLDLELAGRDTFAVSVAATDLVVPSMDIRLRKVEAVLRADRSHAEVDHVWLVHIDSAGTVDTSVVTGVLEYGVEGRFVLGSPTLHAQLRNPGNWVLFFLKPSLLMKSGQVFGDVTLTGNLAVPYMEGRVRIAQARLVVPPLNTAFERVNAEMVFDGGRINIEKLTGRSTRGTVLVTGFVDLGRDWRVDSLRFSSDFTGTTFNPQPEVYAVAGGSVAVDWAPGRPVSVTGTADVQEALLTYGFGQSAGSGGFDTSYVFDVRARAERGVWLRNDLVDIEFSGDLAVRKTLTDMTYSGSLDLRQGTVYYLDHTLRVTSATALFQNINTVNPDINITAEMPVRAAGTGEGTALPDKIVLSVTGTLEQPAISFQSEPPGWTELEIASYLSLNVTPGQLSVLEQKNAVSRLLSERVLGYFQTQVSKRARGLINLDYLSFESGFVGGQGTKVTVGKYVGRNLYVSYTQNFTGEMQPAFQVEYYINRRNELVAERSEDGRYSVRYRLKLRY